MSGRLWRLEFWWYWLLVVVNYALAATSLIADSHIQDSRVRWWELPDESVSVPRLRTEAGSRPACESLSFASPKERNQRKGDPTVCVPCASLRGNLRCSGLAGSRSNSLRFTSLRQSRALIRQTLRSSAHPEGQGEPNIHTGLCFAALRSAPIRGRKRHALRRPSRAQRWPEWMSGCLDVWLPTPAGCACGGAVAG